MGDEKGYNGWTNYETWVVHLSLSNDYGSDCFWTERAEEIISEEQDEEEALYVFAEEIRDFLAEGIPESVSDFYLSLLEVALSEVDTYEIAEAYINIAKEAMEEGEVE